LYIKERLLTSSPVAGWIIKAWGSCLGPADQNAKNTARVGSKQSIVIEMLTRSAGASLEELIAATNWLPHSTRAVLSRLRKGGSEIDRRREVSGTRYYLIVHAAARSA